MSFIDTTNFGPFVSKTVQNEEVNLYNPTASNANLSRSTAVSFNGARADNAQGELGLLQVVHNGTGADFQGLWRFFVNEGTNSTIDPLTDTPVISSTFSLFTVNPNSRFNGTLTVSGTSTFEGNVSVTGDLSVGGSISFASLAVSGNATIGGTLGVSGATTLVGATTIANTLNVTGALSAASLSITGSSVLNGTTTINNNLTVTGTSLFNGVMTVANNILVSGASSTIQLGGVKIADFLGSDADGTGGTPATNLYIDATVSGTNGALYFGDPATSGTWRLIRSGANLLVQLRDGTAYNTRSIFS